MDKLFSFMEKLSFILYILFIYSVSVYAKLPIDYKLAVQYYPKKSFVKKYNIKVVSWGNQLKLREDISKRKNIIKNLFTHGLDIVSADIALKKEGVRFLCSENNERTENSIICGNLAYNYNFYFWKIINSNENLLRKFKKNSVLNKFGNFVYLPFHQKRNIKIPFVSIFSNEYERWIKEQFSLLLETGANAIHVDEPFVGVRYLCKKNMIDYSPNSINLFISYLKNKGYSINTELEIEKFSKEFCEFSLEYLKNKYFSFFRRKTNDNNMLLSSNMNPSEWYFYKFANIFDFLSPEIKHSSQNDVLDIEPLIVYKFANAYDIYTIAVPYPIDWKRMMNSKYKSLYIYTYWIGEALSTNNILVLPISMWTGKNLKKKSILKKLKKSNLDFLVNALNHELNIWKNKKLKNYVEYELILTKNTFKNYTNEVRLILSELISNNILFKIKVVDPPNLTEENELIIKNVKDQTTFSVQINDIDRKNFLNLIEKLLSFQSINIIGDRDKSLFINVLFNKDTKDYVIHILYKNIENKIKVKVSLNKKTWKNFKIVNIKCFPNNNILPYKIGTNQNGSIIEFYMSEPWCVLYGGIQND